MYHFPPTLVAINRHYVSTIDYHDSGTALNGRPDIFRRWAVRITTTERGSKHINPLKNQACKDVPII